jgi:hypothetical protein
MYYDQFGNPDQSVQGRRIQQSQPGFIGETFYPPFDTRGQPMPYVQPVSAMAVPPSGYQPDRYPRRQPRIPRHSDSPISRPKKKSTTRKLVEGGLAAGLGIAATAYHHKHHTRTSALKDPHEHHDATGRSHAGGSHEIGSGGSMMNAALEGAILTAEGVGLAHLRKSKHSGSREGSKSGSESEGTDPRLKRLLEGALATAGAVALAYRDKNTRSTSRREHKTRRP